MKKLKAYTIQFVGLKHGEHNFEYNIDDAFFDHYGYDDFNGIAIKVNLNLLKKPTLMELIFHIEGTVNVSCDLTNEPYDHPIQGDYTLVVKFGHEYNDELEDILILPHGEFEVNVAQYIYETTVLALPAKRVHPGVQDGTLDSEILDKLEELSIKNNNKAEDKKDEIDPRWEKLKDFITDK